MNIFQIILFIVFSAIAYKFFKKSSSLFDFCFVLLVYVVFVGILLYPNILMDLSKIVGIGRGVDLFLYISVFLLFAIVIKLLLMIDKNRQDISKLNRKLTILLKDYPSK